MRIRDSFLVPLLSTALVLPATAIAAPEGEGEGEQAEAEAPPVEEVDPEKLEEAKKLYIKAEKLAKKKKWKEAEELYEQAYYLVPGKHGFAHKVGTAADEAGDCEKAVEYMVHFLTYAVEEKYEDKREEAREVLKHSLEVGCTTEEDLNNIHLTEDEINEKAREIFFEAEELAKAENWAEATELYEQAYRLVPHKVGFSHKVGMAAYKLGDCDKAHEYLVHYVDYADPAKDSEKMTEASGIIVELERSGCVSGQEMEQHAFDNPFEIESENPFDDDKPGDKKKGKGKKGLLVGGALLLTGGVAGIGVGVAGMVLAGSSQSSLDALASTDTATGLPDADYSCRDGGADVCPPTLEQQVANRQLMGIIGLAAGGTLVVVGATLLGLYGKSKKSGGKTARLDSLSPLLLPGGGGGAAAQISF